MGKQLHICDGKKWLAIGGLMYALLADAQTPQQQLDSQITRCKQQLDFQTTPPAGSCMGSGTYSFVRMEDPSPSGETTRVGHLQLSDDVDAIFHCEGVDEAKKQFTGSEEMIIHNKRTGKTCFFERASGASLHSVNFPTLTDATYWTRAGVFRQCVSCHNNGGPYLAMGSSYALAIFGLLNNGHITTQSESTKGQTYSSINADAAQEAFENSLIAQNLQQVGCADSCHAIQPDGFKVTRNQEMTDAGLMPPYFEDSPHQWINHHSPDGSGETESFIDAQGSFPALLKYCAAPGAMEAHPVDIDASNSFSTNNLAIIPDRIKYFNLKDGLLCLNSDQEPGSKCHDYDVRYLCSNGTWTSFYNHDTNVFDDGDHEERSNVDSQTKAICGAAPIGIQARVYLPAPGGTIPQGVYGPNDRLARFSPYGLTCNAADQPDGKCSNYVVRFRSCTLPLKPYAGHLINAWSNMHLTATGSVNNAGVKGQPVTQGWNTQQWMIEPLPNTEYVRLRNTGTNTYLNVTTQADVAVVVTYANQTWDSEKWIIEPVNDSSTVRLKNLWSGKYLTMADRSAYSAVYSQGLNTSWASQRWVIQ